MIELELAYYIIMSYIIISLIQKSVTMVQCSSSVAVQLELFIRLEAAPGVARLTALHIIGLFRLVGIGILQKSVNLKEVKVVLYKSGQG